VIELWTLVEMTEQEPVGHKITGPLAELVITLNVSVAEFTDDPESTAGFKELLTLNTTGELLVPSYTSHRLRLTL